MPVNEARTMVCLIDERLSSARLEVRHADALIRLRAMLEEDVADAASQRQIAPDVQPGALDVAAAEPHRVA